MSNFLNFASRTPSARFSKSTNIARFCSSFLASVTIEFELYLSIQFSSVTRRAARFAARLHVVALRARERVRRNFAVHLDLGRGELEDLVAALHDARRE